jgi:hypothetical protein
MDKFGDSGIDTPKLTPSYQLTALSYSLHKIIIIIKLKFWGSLVVKVWCQQQLQWQRKDSSCIKNANIASPLGCVEVGWATLFL